MPRRASGAMHVARVRRVHGEKEYVSVLLRQSYREGSSVKHRTLASLTALPETVIDAIERSLRGERLVPAEAALRIVRSLPHGHVAAVLGLSLIHISEPTRLGMISYAVFCLKKKKKKKKKEKKQK